MNRAMIRHALAATACVALAACGGSGGGSGEADALPKVSAPAGQAWSAQVRATDGGFVMGNPDAPIKVVEFGSFTCSHCAEFSVASHEALKRDFVDTGRVSFELRPFVRDPLDLLVATVAVCGGPERFFPLAENAFAEQTTIIGGAQAAPDAAQNIAALPEGQRFPALARAWGLNQFFAARGLPEAELNRCLADSAALERRQQVTQAAAERYEIAGTPTFLINDEVAEGVVTWEQLAERLRAAGAR